MGDSMENDTRGWIMCAASAVACVFGSGLINIDVIIRRVPRWRHFRIQDSDKFLAACFSLSFGVMLLSSFLDMWPSAIKELQKGEMSGQEATFITILCFILGFVGIQGFSRFLHSYMPSHVVDCDHTHEDGSAQHSHSHSRSNSQTHGQRPRRQSRSIKRHMDTHIHAHESTPLLDEGIARSGSTRSQPPRMSADAQTALPGIGPRRNSTINRRPSMMQLPRRVLSFVRDGPTACDETGPCKGYTDPCGQECFRHLESRAPTRSNSLLRAMSGNHLNHTHNNLVPLIVPEENNHYSEADAELSPGVTRTRSCATDEDACSTEDEMDMEAQHHHHVPQNAFMNVGLQTSIAIGLHKLPEGFIMFATNHANPALGFNVFFALFIHNIVEGFAMALPLYLALNSRFKAMMYSCVLGGLSQPLGAGLAAAWFAIAGRTDSDPGHVVYGCLFGTVSGIMAAVAILLLLEGVAINHNNAWCSAFVLLGFVIFGVSTALRA